MNEIKTLMTIESGKVPKREGFYVVIDKEEEHPLEIDAVDLLPKNIDEITEVLFVRTGELQKNSQGHKEGKVKVFHINTLEELQEAQESGIYILDDIKEPL